MINKIAAFVLWVGVIGCDAKSQCESFIRRTEINEKFSGIVLSAYFNHKDGGRGTPTILWEDNSKTSVASTMLVCYLQKGDSVNKPIGAMKTYVYRGDSIKEFYPDCGEMLILEDNKQAPNPQFGIDCGKNK